MTIVSQSKDATWWFRIGAGLFTLLILIGIYRLSTIESKQQIKFKKYNEFDISIPEAYSIHGIDVSAHNGRVSWDRVKMMEDNGLKLIFVFIKATEGYAKIDLEFPRNWAGSKQENIYRGAYHFFLATKNGYDQAQNFIQSVKLEAGDLPPVLDIEHLYGVSADSMRARLLVWIKTVKKHYGVDPIIYTNVKFYQKHLAGFVDQYPVWVAHYLQKEKPRIERQWQFWQHSEKGKVYGIRTRVDFNVFNGTNGQFEQLLIQ